MDGSNLLSGGVDKLKEIKESLLELHGYEEKNNTLNASEEKLEKNIETLEKSIAEETQTTTRKRRQEIEDTFDKQIEKTRSRIKKIQDRRDKNKDKKVSQRVDTETALLKEENRTLNLEAKSVLKLKKVPAYCNTKFYYALYAPRCFTDFLIVIIMLLLILVAIPCGLYFFVLPDKKIMYLILIYVVTVIIFGLIYVILGNHTKEKHPDEIKRVKGIRQTIRVNKRKIKVIKNNIRKDRDESAYGLENFDEELSKLNQEITEFATQKKEALATFDNTTIPVIAAEIQGENEDQLKGFKTRYEETQKEAKKAEINMKALAIKIASEYEAFIGKDLMSMERLDSLINIIQAGSANNISEAIAYFHQNGNGTTENKNNRV
ncbi:MAG: hypothetical protein WBI07_14510 [Mobilitalea sp.]